MNPRRLDRLKRLATGAALVSSAAFAEDPKAPSPPKNPNIHINTAYPDKPNKPDALLDEADAGADLPRPIEVYPNSPPPQREPKPKKKK